MQRQLGKIAQIAFMTRDIFASIDHFVRNLGIGPWFMIEGGSFGECRYRGQPSNVLLTTAFANARGLEFELMQLDGGQPSMWHDALQTAFHRESFHHWCIWPDDYDATLNMALAEGYAVYQDGSTSRGRFVYLEHPTNTGDILELTERTPPRRAFQQLVARSGADWNGCNPIRTKW